MREQACCVRVVLHGSALLTVAEFVGVSRLYSSESVFKKKAHSSLQIKQSTGPCEHIAKDPQRIMEGTSAPAQEGSLPRPLFL